MTTIPYVTARKASKKSDGNYGSDETSIEIFVPLDVNQAHDPTYRMQMADVAAREAQAVLLAQDETTANVVPISAAPSAPAPSPNHPSMQQQPQMSPQQVADHMGGALVIPADPSQYSGDVKSWARERVNYLLNNDQNTLRDEWWDNRVDKRNPKAPDFKHKQNGDWAVWLD